MMDCPLVEDLRQKVMFNESQRTHNVLEWKAVAFEQKRIADELEKFWRERVKPLIKAGQAMRESQSTSLQPYAVAWDAALAEAINAGASAATFRQAERSSR